MTDSDKNINIEGDVEAWLANISGTVTIHNFTLNQWRENQPTELHAQTNEPVFISYSRTNTDFAQELYIKLRALGFSLWRDRTEMVAGESWWTQIQDAIRGSQTMVLCISPKALESPVVTDEWRYARREGTRVIPVLAEDVDFSAVPRWMAKLDWLDFRENSPERDIIWAKFINQLNAPHQRRAVIFNVPSLPAHFVHRPNVFDPLLAQLLDDSRQNPVAITTALQGGGEFGKTTLAMALCHDQQVRDAYDNGILWVAFGENPDVLALLNAQIKELGSDDTKTEIDIAGARLRDLLEDKDILLVLDDVWNPQHAEPFLQRTEKTRATFLLTTRQQDVVQEAEAADPVMVDEMTDAQSVRLLSSGLEDADAHTEALQALAQHLGEWALMLKLANGVLRKQIARYGFAEAIERINEDLDAEGFTTFDSRNAEARHQSISKSLNVSLNLLDDDERRCLAEVAVCRENADVPVTTLAALWNMKEERQALRLCETFSDYSLIRFDSSKKTANMHAVIRGILALRLSVLTVN